MSVVDVAAPYAQELQRKTGIPASVTLAQLVLESGWNPSALFTQANNPFGVKADAGWPGRKVYMDTQEYENGGYVNEQAAFRAYDNLQQAFDDRGVFLNGSRYKPILGGVTDPYKYAEGLQQAGYATDPQYANKLKSLIPQFAKYDSGVVTVPVAPGTVSWIDKWMESNSAAWGEAGSKAEKDFLHFSNTVLGSLKGAVYDQSTGQWSQGSQVGAAVGLGVAVLALVALFGN